MIRNSRSKRGTRRALLIFADPSRLDLSRRHFPATAHGFLRMLPAECAEKIPADIHVFNSGSRAVFASAQSHCQVGNNFAERFENAIETVASLGYDEIVAVGRDCPRLCESDIETAFEQLKNNRLVLGPDHRGGCYLIAFHSSDKNLIRGVRWKQNTDCAQLRERCLPAEVSLLTVKQDIDSWDDIRMLAREGGSPAGVASFLLKVVGSFNRATSHFVDLSSHWTRVRGQMPPPGFAL
jgi:glycosyltransferase A (GT-A) superfamily protein (DUF2064 family)